MTGLFITMEGIEGCGKSTQIGRLQLGLEKRGYPVVTTREPGGTAVAEAIRTIVLNPKNASLSPVTELLLYAAARAQHVDERIRPALEAGKVVLCDRFADSTTAYQGAGRELSQETIHTLHAIATRGTWPDLTIVLDLPVEEGLKRAGRGAKLDRIEREPLDFHRRVREGFLRIARDEPERVRVVNGNQPVDEVAAAVWALVEPRLGAP